jgi:hypothetical protein
MLVLLDVVIGVSFVYLLLALVCTTANEWVASVGGLRGQTLDLGIRRMLGPLADDFFRHPLIASLSRPGKRPSYVPANLFSSAVLDLLGRHEDTAPPVQQVKAGLAALNRKTPAAAHDHAMHAAALEEWFNNSMDRVSGWYKRRMQLVALLVAAAVTLLTNADTLQIVGVLWRTPSRRAELVEQARQRVKAMTHTVVPPKKNKTNPKHVFEIHPITIFEGTPVLETFAPVHNDKNASDHYEASDAKTAFARYEKAKLTVSRAAVFTSFDGPQTPYNYTEFILEVAGPRQDVADGAFVDARILDLQKHVLVSESRRMVLVKGTRPATVIGTAALNKQIHVLGIPRINLNEVVRKVAAGHKDVVPGAYEMIILAVIE